MNERNPNFAKNIKILRESLGLNQAEVAHAIGVNSRTYQKYEYGEATPGDAKKEKLAKLLKVQISDLYKPDIRPMASRLAIGAPPVEPPASLDLIQKELHEIKAKLNEKGGPSLDPEKEKLVSLISRLNAKQTARATRLIRTMLSKATLDEGEDGTDPF